MLIDRDKAIEAIDEVRDLISVEAYCAITERLKELPSAEHHKLNVAEYIKDNFPDVWKQAEKELEVPSAEPQIIRCEDCKHSYDDIGGTYCSYGVCVDCVVDLDFFCRYGERREEE